MTPRTLATVAGLWLLASSGALFLLPTRITARAFEAADRIAGELVGAVIDGIHLLDEEAAA